MEQRSDGLSFIGKLVVDLDRSFRFLDADYQASVSQSCNHRWAHLETQLHPPTQNDMITTAFDQLINIGNLYARIMTRSRLAPIPATSAAREKLDIFKRPMPLDLDHPPLSLAKAQTRLDAKQVASLCGMYQSGSSLADVAKRFKIHRQTASAHLKRNGIDRRASIRKMTDAQAEAATELRRAGWSYYRLSDYFGVDRATVRKEVEGLGN